MNLMWLPLTGMLPVVFDPALNSVALLMSCDKSKTLDSGQHHWGEEKLHIGRDLSQKSFSCQVIFSLIFERNNVFVENTIFTCTFDFSR